MKSYQTLLLYSSSLESKKIARNLQHIRFYSLDSIMLRNNKRFLLKPNILRVERQTNEQRRMCEKWERVFEILSAWLSNNNNNNNNI